MGLAPPIEVNVATLTFSYILSRKFQLKKMQDRTARTKDEVSKCRERYEQALQEINKYNPVYIEDMTSVFIKCQEMEETRLRFFKNVLFSIHKCLNISEDPSLPQIYKEFHHTVNNADHLKDLKWWSNNHGVNMGMSWPTFVVSWQLLFFISTRFRMLILTF